MFDFSPNHPGAELLLKQGAGEESPASEPRQTREQPRWNWPDSFRLDLPLFIPEGQTLWMMHPRELPWPERLIKFQDGRHATLLHFKPGIRDSFSLPLAFRKDGQPIDPFNFRFFDPGFPLGAPFCLVTDQGLVVACPALAGHWLVPSDALQSRLKPVASPVSQPAAGKGETVGQGSGNASPGASKHSNLLLTP
jgi:hypothetical protein